MATKHFFGVRKVRGKGSARLQHDTRPVRKPAAPDGDGRIGRRTRTPEDLRIAILALLADKPLRKWEIREQVHEPEGFIYRELVRLRDEKKVKVVGKALDRRAWALAAWRPSPASRLAHQERPYVVLVVAPPADSWWARPFGTRAEFNDAQAARARAANWLGKPSAPDGSP